MEGAKASGAIEWEQSTKANETEDRGLHLGLDEDLEANDGKVAVAVPEPDDGICGVHQVVMRPVHDEAAPEIVVREHLRRAAIKSRRGTQSRVRQCQEGSLMSYCSNPSDATVAPGRALKVTVTTVITRQVRL